MITPLPEDVLEVRVQETGEVVRISKDDCQKTNPPKFDKVR